MESIFGVPMGAIMIIMLVILALCLSVVAYIYVARKVIFNLGVRNIPRRKAQTSLIVVGLMLATLIIAAALGTGDTLNRSVSSDVYKSLGEVDELVVYSNTGDGEGNAGSVFSRSFDEAEVAYFKELLAGNEDVDAVGGILFSMAPALNVADATIGPETDITDVAVQSEPQVVLAGLDSETYSVLGGLKTPDGSAIDFSILGTDGVILGETAADDLAAEVGDTIVLFLNNQQYSMVVKAIAQDSPLTGYVQPNQPSLMMDLDQLQAISGKDGQISAIGISNKGNARSGVKLTDDVVSVLKPAVEGKELGIVEIKKDNVELAELVSSIFVSFFLIFGLFSIAVGILLIVLIFTMLAAERRAEMGMARAVGARRGALIQQFIAEGTGYALLAGLVGTVLGAAVAMGIAQGLGAVFGDFINIEPYVRPRSMVVAYSIGVVITFLAVAVSSWRVSRLNIVAAVRDIPDTYVAKRNRRQLIWSILMVVGGALLTYSGYEAKTAFSFFSGMTLIPFGVAGILSFLGVKPRLALTLAGLYSLVFWMLPDDAFTALFGEISGDMEMFFVSGICMIASATIVIVQNLSSILKFVERLSSRFTNWLPAFRLAVAYPGANKGRTGMTIAMFGLIVFSITMVASITENFGQAFFSRDSLANWDVRVEVPYTNPVDDFNGELTSDGVAVDEFTSVGMVTNPNLGELKVRNTQGADLDWEQSFASVGNAQYYETSDLEFQARANGYDSDEAILQALNTDPNVVVIPNSMLVADPFAESSFVVEGIEEDASTFEPVALEFTGPDGSVVTLQVIGVLDTKYSTMFGFWIGSPAGEALFADSGETVTTYYVQLQDGVDITDTAQSIERALLKNGAQATDLQQELDDQQAGQKSFFYILQGFMGLGLVVGIAAVGVIAMRAVVERRQQIGMMRALGFQKALVARTFVIESAVVVILGVAAGASLGLYLAWMLMSGDEFADGADFQGFIVPWMSLGITIAAAVLAALIMAWLPARQAAKVVPAEALRYE